MGARSGELRSARTTGAARRTSSSGGTSVAPGRVDCAPTSMMSAPLRSMSSACATAARVSKYSPPSEKESGVTLSTPIRKVRDPHRRSAPSSPIGVTR